MLIFQMYKLSKLKLRHFDSIDVFGEVSKFDSGFFLPSLYWCGMVWECCRKTNTLTCHRRFLERAIRATFCLYDVQHIIFAFGHRVNA